MTKIVDYRIPKSHYWRPILGYEAELTPLIAQPMTNLLIDPCYASPGMLTEPLKFPNLVTGFNLNPIYAAHVALYMRYTPYDWIQNKLRLYNEADVNKSYSEKLRKNTLSLIREIDEKIKQTENRENEESLEMDVSWRNKAALELKKLIIENYNMKDRQRDLQIAIQNLESQLHVAQECIYHRESRKGTDLVHDEAESALLKEIEVVRNCQKKLEHSTSECINQLANSKIVQNQLVDIRHKKMLGIHTMCHQMNNFRQDLQYKNVEKYAPNIIETESWVDTLKNVLKKSQVEREKSSQLKNDISATINTVGCEIWQAWINTNNSLAKRNIELLEAKEKSQMRLHKIQEEIFDIEKSLKLMQNTIIDKSSILKTVQLEPRTIIKEVDEMNIKLQKLETQYQQLLRTKSNLENDLRCKIHALFIDREKCMGIRRSCPISLNMKF